MVGYCLFNIRYFITSPLSACLTYSIWWKGVVVKNLVRQLSRCHNGSDKLFEIFIHCTNSQNTECGIWIDLRVYIVIRQFRAEILVKLLCFPKVGISIVYLKSVEKKKIQHYFNSRLNVTCGFESRITCRQFLSSDLRFSHFFFLILFQTELNSLNHICSSSL